MSKTHDRCTEKAFLKSVAKHSIDIQHDSGVFRSLCFSNNGSFNMRFTLTTWPGYLAISGDMGDFLFSRLDDMFNFFRTEPLAHRDGTIEGLPINPGYWSEKCRSVSIFGGRETFDMERFRGCVKSDFDSHYEGSATKRATKRACWAEIEDRVLAIDPECDFTAHQAARDFVGEDGFTFSDFWEHDLTSYTYHFIWCLYAITWGIRQYDAAKNPTERTA